MHKLRTVVLEDEDDNRNWLLKKLNLYPELDIVGEASTLDDAFGLIAQTKPDAAFMDIQLIGGDVFMLLKRLQDNGIPIPYIVITTGYPEYVMNALNDYRRFVVQYLVKPFLEDWQKKLRKSIDALMAAKLNDTFSIPVPKAIEPQQTQNSIFVNNRGSLLRLDFYKIAYFEAAGGGETYVVTDTDTHQVDLTLNKFLDLLPSERFQRISKINIINVSRILRVNREDRTVDIEHGAKHKTLGVGDSFYTEMIRNLPLAKESAVKAATVYKSAENRVVLDREVAGKLQNLQDEKSELIIEKQKSDNLLRNILPDDVAEELKQTGQTTAKKFDLVTVMFCDIKDFTRISENMSPEDLIKDIDFCFRHFDEIMEKHRIEKIKTIGDCYMCAGGLPKPDDDNPLRVVQAAIEMQQFLRKFKASRQDQQLPWFDARIGIHSGPVVAGVVGQLKFTYDIWGDTVNIAARIEQMGEVGHINLSADTYHHVKRHFACRYAGTVDAKNIGELEVYLIEVV